MNFSNAFHHYTIPSDNRELQHAVAQQVLRLYYTIPSDNRELQQLCNATGYAVHYTIPSDNRELQLILIHTEIC